LALLGGACDMCLGDAGHGGFSLDLGIEIDGVRLPLLPILARLRERDGLAAVRIVDGDLVTSLDDGRILKLPADRIARLLGVMDDLIEAARRNTGDALVLDASIAAQASTNESAFWYAQGDGTRTDSLSENPRIMVSVHFPNPTGFSVQKIGLFLARQDNDRRVSGIICFPLSR
jgi:hypothetical protein